MLNGMLENILPEGWSFHALRMATGRTRDGTLDVLAPKGPVSRFAVELKGRVDPRDVDRLERLSATLPAGQRLLVVAPYFSTRSRQLLRQRNISYVDSTSNAWISGDSLLIDRTGSDKPPKNGAEPRARTSLRGPITGRIIRFLCDVRPPLKVREIAAGTDVHPGNVSRILELVERERLVERSGRGSVSSVDWEALIERWSTDLAKDRHVESFLEPRGIQVVTRRLATWNVPYAITGPFASAELTPVAVPLAIDIYVTDVEEARKALALRRSERIGNVRLVEAFDRSVFERTMRREDLILAAPTQIAADVLTIPTRSPDEYRELIEWMKRHEASWRC